MAIHDKDWFIQRHRDLAQQLTETQAQISTNIESGDFSLAIINADTLKTQLETINKLANHMADKGLC